jgi:hypothetical protein
MNDQPTTRHQVLRIILDWAHPDGDGDKAAELIDAIYREATPMTDQPTRGWLVACPWCGEATGSWPVSAQMAHLIEHGDALRERNAALEGERATLKKTDGSLEQHDPHDDPLVVEVIGGRLVISIGVRTLAFSLTADGGPIVHPTRITDPLAFAREMVPELSREDEEGMTPVNVLLDQAAERAIENGADGVGA